MSEGDNPYRSPKSDRGKPTARRWTKWAALSLVLLATAVAMYSLYASVFFGWIATTPGPVETHSSARLYSNLWQVAFLVSSACAIGLIVWLIYVTRVGESHDPRP